MQRQIIGQDITSSRTHHILQASATLNRRYVRRPVAQTTPSTQNQNSVSITFKNKQTQAAPKKSSFHVSISDGTEIKPRQTHPTAISHFPKYEPKMRESQPAQPAQPIHPIQTVHPTQPVQLAQPIHLTQPVQSAQPVTPRSVKNPYTTSAIIRKAAEKIQQNPSGFSPIFDQQSKMDRAFSAVSEQEKQILENIEKPTAIFTKSKKSFVKPLVKSSLKPKAPIKSPAKKLTRAAIPAANMTTSSVESAFSRMSEDPKAKQVAAATQPKNVKPVKKSIHKKSTRLAFALFCSTAVVASLFFIAQTNMPDISVRVAAMQTGIQATYPSYIPREYRLSGVYTTQDNSVAMDFTGPNQAKFTLTEEKLPWDSNALLNRYVKTKWGENYDSVREQGITIYISGSNAAWVNAGIVYKINNFQGELTKKQIKNIVTSL
ncbi:hypothetical protein HG461_002340 [Candidatus Saccharibacteria bacterium]|nr:hypothetical protein [Candidatus Saccharibacteria bacterium]MBB1532245.1 hypothetical protein [Candidatus Saccharibacteria bacterium]